MKEHGQVLNMTGFGRPTMKTLCLAFFLIFVFYRSILSASKCRCEVMWGVNSRRIYPRSCNWACTLRNSCCAGWQISWGWLLLNNLLASDPLFFNSQTQPLSFSGCIFLHSSHIPACTSQQAIPNRWIPAGVSLSTPLTPAALQLAIPNCWISKSISKLILLLWNYLYL
jgi:hypothetical protein